MAERRPMTCTTSGNKKQLEKVQKWKPKLPAIARARRGKLCVMRPSKSALSANEKPIQPPARLTRSFIRREI